MKTVAIIGAGASGLACVKALLPYQHMINIKLFERNAMIGKKIAATGNGRCNLSNAHLTHFAYQGDYLPLFEDLMTFDIKTFCLDLGFLTRKKDNLYYPYSEQAKTVVNAFERMISNNKIDLYLNTQIVEIKAQKEYYFLKSQDGTIHRADYVVVGAGGKAGKGFGTDGQIFDVLKSLGLNSTRLSPSLVAMITKENVKKLKGCRVHGTFTLKKDGIEIASYKGEALFNEQGISGIAIMQLSRFLTLNQPYTLHCNLIDDLEEEELINYYNLNKNKFNGIIQDKLSEYLSFKNGSNYQEFKERLSDLTFNIVGTKDFEFAQVTKGGIPLYYLNENLMVKHLPNFYLCGEVLNVDGDCGGYNLHFAFTTGQKVGNAIGEKIGQ